MRDEPLGGVLGDRVERSRFLEQMRRVRHYDQLLFAPERFERALVQLEHDRVALADDQERRRAHAAERLTGESATAARDDSGDDFGPAPRRQAPGFAVLYRSNREMPVSPG
jgi:hypothetical protein